MEEHGKKEKYQNKTQHLNFGLTGKRNRWTELTCWSLVLGWSAFSGADLLELISLLCGAVGLGEGKGKVRWTLQSMGSWESYDKTLPIGASVAQWWNNTMLRGIQLCCKLRKMPLSEQTHNLFSEKNKPITWKQIRVWEREQRRKIG